MNDTKTDNTLHKNLVKNFILRIDLIKTEENTMFKIANAMSKYFDRIEKRQLSNFEIEVTTAESKIRQNDKFDYVLVSESRNLNMTFSEVQDAFWIESNQYKNNSIYKEIIECAVNEIKLHTNSVESKRLGLRYINEFRCERKKDIGKIYGKRLSSIVKNMSQGSDNKSRIIGVEEWNCDGLKTRIQYGIVNKFYPSVITLWDLLLDIDSFIESTHDINECSGVIRELNHNAYEKFMAEMNPKFIESIR